MKVAIIGYGIEGRSACAYWQARGATVTVCDQNTAVVLPAGVQGQLGEAYLAALDAYDIIVRSPGVHPSRLLAENPGIESKITSTVNEFLRVCPTRNVIGVTGTKGKGTTSTIITKILAATGKTVHLVGNIGLPVLDILPELNPDSWVVLELSSFQLHDVQHSPHIGVCLMVMAEHLNWHASLHDYKTAKAHLFAYQQPDDIAIYFADNPASHEAASHSPGKKISYFAPPGAYVGNSSIMIDGQTICAIDELRLIGKHNWQNVCAAVTAVWQITQDIAAIRSVLTTFSGLEHRLEFVRTVNGVAYYDDSFGTTPETTMVAIQAFDTPKVVILGGSDKGADFTKLAKTIANGNVRAAIIIGQTGPAIAEKLRAEGFTAMIDGGTTMTSIVAQATAAAEKGDIVLLATGCASFGLFKDYKDRGDQFKAVVSAL